MKNVVAVGRLLAAASLIAVTSPVCQAVAQDGRINPIDDGTSQSAAATSDAPREIVIDGRKYRIVDDGAAEEAPKLETAYETADADADGGGEATAETRQSEARQAEPPSPEPESKPAGPEFSVEFPLLGMGAAAQAGDSGQSDAPHLKYGLRLGAGAFLASAGVSTYAIRAEGVIPIYGGDYEVGIMARLAGGNGGGSHGCAAMALVRWRYNDLPYVDFAVGAGLGVGTLAGFSDPRKNSDTGDADVVSSAGQCQDEQPDCASAAPAGLSKKNQEYQDLSGVSVRYAISAIAAFKIDEMWRPYVIVEAMGGTNWGVDLGAGLEVRF